MAEHGSGQGGTPVNLSKGAAPGPAAGGVPATGRSGTVWVVLAGVLAAAVVVVAGVMLGGPWVMYGLLAAVPVGLGAAWLTRRAQPSGIFAGLGREDRQRLQGLLEGVAFAAAQVDDPGQLQYSLVCLNEVGVGVARELFLSERVVFAAGCVVQDGGPRTALVAVATDRVLLGWAGASGATAVVSRALGEGLSVELQLVRTGAGTGWESSVRVPGEPGEPELVFSVVDDARGLCGTWARNLVTRGFRPQFG